MQHNIWKILKKYHKNILHLVEDMFNSEISVKPY